MNREDRKFIPFFAMAAAALIVAVTLVIVIIIISLIVNFVMKKVRHEKFAYSDPNVVPGAVISRFKSAMSEMNRDGNSNKWPGPPDTLVAYHFTTRCPHCVQMRPIWEAVKSSLANGNVRFIENDEGANPTIGITGVPAIYLYKNGVAFEYDGMKDVEHLKKFILSATHERMSQFPLKR